MGAAMIVLLRLMPHDVILKLPSLLVESLTSNKVSSKRSARIWMTILGARTFKNMVIMATFFCICKISGESEVIIYVRHISMLPFIEIFSYCHDFIQMNENNNSCTLWFRTNQVIPTGQARLPS